MFIHQYQINLSKSRMKTVQISNAKLRGIPNVIRILGTSMEVTAMPAVLKKRSALSMKGIAT